MPNPRILVAFYYPTETCANFRNTLLQAKSVKIIGTVDDGIGHEIIRPDDDHQRKIGAPERRWIQVSPPTPNITSAELLIHFRTPIFQNTKSFHSEVLSKLLAAEVKGH